jgi:NAD(P)H-nitrite reductase large subunit
MSLLDRNQAYACRCEEVSLAAVQQAIDEGALTIDDVKRRTRAGMGICQGIFCTRTIAQQIASRAHVPLADLQPMTSRPPVRLISLDNLADRDGTPK